MSLHDLHSWSVFAVAFFGWGSWELRQDRELAWRHAELVLGALLASAVGGRLGGVLVNLDEFLEHPVHLLTSRYAPFLYYGGAIAAVAFFFVFTKWRRIPRWRVADVLARSTLLYWGVEQFGDAVLGFRPVGFELGAALVFLVAFAAMVTRRKEQKFPGEAVVLLVAVVLGVRASRVPITEAVRLMVDRLT